MKKKTSITLFSDGASARLHNKLISFIEENNKTMIIFKFADADAETPACAHKCHRGKVRETFIQMSTEAMEALFYTYSKYKTDKIKQKADSSFTFQNMQVVLIPIERETFSKFSSAVMKLPDGTLRLGDISELNANIDWQPQQMLVIGKEEPKEGDYILPNDKHEQHTLGFYYCEKTSFGCTYPHGLQTKHVSKVVAAFPKIESLPSIKPEEVLSEYISKGCPEKIRVRLCVNEKTDNGWTYYMFVDVDKYIHLKRS